MKGKVLLCVAAAAATAFGSVRDEVRDAANRQIADGMILGAVVAAKGFEPLATGCRLFAPMDAETRFDCASVTKTVVAMTCARLAAQGLVDVDRPFTDYLTEHVLAKEGCTITVRDLALHVGGFGGDISYQRHRDYAEFRRAAMNLRPERKPREKYQYLCINMIYVGWIVEKATGLPLDVAAKKYVLDPLGMTHSSWGPLPADANVAYIPIALSHLSMPCWKGYNAGIGWPSDPGANFAAPHPIGNAGLFSTAGDLLLFVRDLVERRTFEPKAYELVLTCGYEDGPTRRRSFGFDMSADMLPAGFTTNAVMHTGWSGQTIVADPSTGDYGVALTARACLQHGKCRRARGELITNALKGKGGK